MMCDAKLVENDAMADPLADADDAAEILIRSVRHSHYAPNSEATGVRSRTSLVLQTAGITATTGEESPGSLQHRFPPLR